MDGRAGVPDKVGMSASASQSRRGWLIARVRRHVSELARLALPVTVSRVGIIGLALVDTLMVGQYSAVELGYLAIGVAPTQAISTAMVGLMMGTLVMTAHAYGREDSIACGQVFRRSVSYGFAIGLIALVLCFFGTPFLRLAGQSEALAVGGGQVMQIIGYGLPAQGLYLAAAFFLEGVKKPIPVMLVMGVGNLVNILANWLLVYGVWVFPELGAEGSAWATTIVRTFMAIVLVAYVFAMADRDRYGVRRRWTGGWRAWADQRRLGYASGLSIGMEAGAFSALSLIAGLLGTVALGAFAIAFNVFALVFMVALGIASATAVRVGIAHGRRDAADTALAGWTGLGVNSLAMLLVGLVFLAAGPAIADLFSDEVEQVAIAGGLIAFSAWILIADGGQVVMSHALRGRGDAWVPTASHLLSYWGIMVPCGYLFAVVWQGGVIGLFWSILVASIVSVGLLALRFLYLSWRDRIYGPPAAESSRLE